MATEIRNKFTNLETTINHINSTQQEVYITKYVYNV